MCHMICVWLSRVWKLDIRNCDKRNHLILIQMWFKIVLFFTFKEIPHFTLQCVISLFGLLYSPKRKCENQGHNGSFGAVWSYLRLYIVCI